MNYKLLVATAVSSIYSWRRISNEMLAVAMTLSAYFMASMLMDDPATKASTPAFMTSVLQGLFWPTIIISGISLAIASMKSALPSLVAWALVVPLYLLGLAFAAKVALMIACVAIFLFAVGFALHGGRAAGN